MTASPHTSSTPNINSVRHADSRGSLISTDSGNSLPEKHNDKGNSLDKVELRKYFKIPIKWFHPTFIRNLIQASREAYQRSPSYDKSSLESHPLLTCTINFPTLPVRLATADWKVCSETLCQCPALLYGDWGEHALRAQQTCYHGLLPALCPLCARERPAAQHFTSSTKTPPSFIVTLAPRSVPSGNVSVCVRVRVS